MTDPPTVEHLQRQLAIADITGETVVKDRDRLSRELAAMTKERDEALAALPRPVYQLLEELGALRLKYEEERRDHQVQLGRAKVEGDLCRDENRLLISEREQLRRINRGLEARLVDAADLREQLVRAKTDLQEAQARVLELAVGTTDDTSSILEERSARTRAIDAVCLAERAVQQQDDARARTFVAISMAWARVAGLLEKQ